MKIIPATPNDLNDILEAIRSAQGYLKKQHIDQWQDDYPNEHILIRDIQNGESYLVKNDEDETIGTTMFSLRPEPTYKVIEGKWLTATSATYGVIHRMAVIDRFRGKGFSSFVFNYFENLLIEKNTGSMRIDTHQDNKLMQAVLTKRGYQYCGVIQLDSGSLRLAFEKVMR